MQAPQCNRFRKTIIKYGNAVCIQPSTLSAYNWTVIIRHFPSNSPLFGYNCRTDFDRKTKQTFYRNKLIETKSNWTRNVNYITLHGFPKWRGRVVPSSRAGAILLHFFGRLAFKTVITNERVAMFHRGRFCHEVFNEKMEDFNANLFPSNCVHTKQVEWQQKRLTHMTSSFMFCCYLPNEIIHSTITR